MKNHILPVFLAALMCAASCKPEALHPTSVSVSPSAVIMVEGETTILSVSVQPAEVQYSGINGTATITVSTEDGGKTAICTVTVLPEGALSGVFSVSDTKQVRFSKGNLQATYDGSKYSWGFAVKQYDYIGNAPGNTTIDSQKEGEVVDLFGWSTDANYFGISTSRNNNDFSGDFVDWGKNIGDGSKWRTLSKDEWDYIFKTRTNASDLYKLGVTVCGKTNCLIIAPDGYTGTIAESYDASTWPAAEADGLVCLPAAGGRLSSNIYDVDSRGQYNTLSADYKARFMLITDYRDPDIWIGSSYCGNSVRLVADVK